ncbi:hypothetical protein [Leptolyngbya sp. NIES-2104]|uniref:hypothetical protein n=1 Tax=Leptolyngbya sp. NIES-2104 TaxID=1552121 RepID=UPI0006EC4EB9|nr:hypothetical protein [Leptolyngbya sp. NIES-2104]GAQ00144.1 hypothetical protein NIES2104_67090 [Leptolyngbya sp. NIES-2104]
MALLATLKTNEQCKKIHRLNSVDRNFNQQNHWHDFNQESDVRLNPTSHPTD